MKLEILPFAFRLELSSKETTTWATRRRALDWSNLATRWITVEVERTGSARVDLGPGRVRQADTPARDELLALLREHALAALPDGHPCRAFVKEGRITFKRAEKKP